MRKCTRDKWVMRCRLRLMYTCICADFWCVLFCCLLLLLLMLIFSGIRLFRYIFSGKNILSSLFTMNSWRGKLVLLHTHHNLTIFSSKARMLVKRKIAFHSILSGFMANLNKWLEDFTVAKFKINKIAT